VHCGYCQKLHQELPELNAAGVAVRCAAFPAIRPTSTPDHVSVWCAEDRQQAITNARAGKEIAARTCENPVDRQFEVGRTLGVQGTPAIVLEDGEVLPGYVPARQLVQRPEAAAETRAAVAR
jgi:thiol:disulfide interchange protein DsbC